MDNGDRHLSPHQEPTMFELVRQDGLLDRLQEPRSQARMHLKGRVNDLPGNFVFWRRGNGLAHQTTLGGLAPWREPLLYQIAPTPGIRTPPTGLTPVARLALEIVGVV